MDEDKLLIITKIKDKNALKLIDSIIDSTDEKYINEEIIRLKNNEKNKILIAIIMTRKKD